MEEYYYETKVDEDGRVNLNIRSEVEGMTLTMGLGYKSEEDALEALGKFDKLQAEAIRKSMVNILEE